jgi:hypothetical protein
MYSHLKTACLTIATFVLVAGCAAPQPVPFQLVDSASAVQKGTIFPDRRGIEVTIDGQQYKGFYLVSTAAAHSQYFGGWRYAPHQSITTFTSNAVRAQLSSEKGQRLSCEFLFEERRAIGECKSPAGAVYQLTADGN